MSTIVEAEKLAGCVQLAPIADNAAISVRATWDSIASLVGINVPLRRPKRKAPQPSLSEELAAWDAASDEVWESIED